MVLNGRAMAAQTQPTRRIEERLARGGGWVEALWLPAALFGALAGLRGALYDRGLLPSRRVAAPARPRPRCGSRAGSGAGAGAPAC
jgi:hypothetical protein